MNEDQKRMEYSWSNTEKIFDQLERSQKNAAKELWIAFSIIAVITTILVFYIGASIETNKQNINLIKKELAL